MIIIGGYDELLCSLDRYWCDLDFWFNGFGVFDLIEMRWSNEYNVVVEGYKLLVVVKMWYLEGGLELVVWLDNILKWMFLEF